MPTPVRPTISVVIPVHNAAEYLTESLRALARSTNPPLECIVVDDGSTDNSAQIASIFGARVLATGGRAGPARARNLGARAARGSILFFIDADVCVQPDTIARILADFSSEPGVDALIGSYDHAPSARNFISQYRNLMHAFVHQTADRDACTFWSGCGAIKREVFLANGGFDESYGRPAIEDIELGTRLVRSGRSIRLDRHLQVKHLKKWTLFNLLKTDILDRGIPWTELILREQSMPDDLNLKVYNRVSVVLVFLMLGLALIASFIHRGYFVTPVLALLMMMLSRYWVDEVVWPGSRSMILAIAALFCTILVSAYHHNMLKLVPPLLLAWAFLYVRNRYVSQERHRRRTGLIYGIYSVVVVLYIIAFLPVGRLATSFLLVSFAIAAINFRFYVFLAHKIGKLYVLSALPFHFLYYFYSGLSFLIGAARHSVRSRLIRRSPAPSS